MNTNIKALQTIVEVLQKNESVTSVVPITEGGVEVGYTIAFTSGKNITIYHGKDGVDGSDGKDGQNGTNGSNGLDGKDGYTPVIGVKQDADGVYYWTIDGEYLLDDAGNKIPTTGKDGQNGSDGAPGHDGANGTPGSNGQNGTDGVTPQLKIENGMWHVSYDNGASWIELGQATGDQGPQGNTGATGPQGNPGVSGDSMFTNIDYSSSTDFVIFVLSNGLEIKVPTWYSFEALKQQCEQMNTNIEALQVIVNALQNNDYITSIIPIYEGGKEVGYIINFTKSGKVTIYHGQDGKDGQDGANGSNGTNGTDGVDGHTPIIGVAKDTDGIYYWTVDGSWLLDENGQKVKAVGVDGQNGSNGSNGQDGANGADGAPGAAGKDGVTPQLKIENGMWHVSYDNGASWIELGQATGDQGPQGNTGATGPQGNPGVDGDAFFQTVDTSNSDYVSFVLANGTEIKVPTWSAFEALKQQCEQMNTNIEALQVIVNALQNNDYITSITPIYEGGKEVGYIINFTKSGKVTIYHGKDGQNGANGSNGTNGVDGHSPIVGVAKDTDGFYYWTVDGSWLLDENGQKVKAVGIDGQNGSNGSNGQDGANGAAGKDGVTPQLKIENGMWYVSYDNGASWIELGQATGDQGPQGNTGATGPQGPQGTPGVNGDAFFQSVTETKDYVSMVLANGTEIKIPKYSAVAATLTLGKVTGFTATFDGQVVRHSLDLKVTVYYSTTDNLTVYKHKGKTSVTEFNGDSFTLRLTELAANTTYYYFTEVVCNGVTTFSEISLFRTDKEDSYVDWGEGENIGGDI